MVKSPAHKYYFLHNDKLFAALTMGTFGGLLFCVNNEISSFMLNLSLH